MTEAARLLLAGVFGVALGTFFFGGLWWTVRKAMASKQPALWISGSLLLRTGGSLFGFYVVAGGDWRRWLACVLGFVMARVAVTRLSQLPDARRTRIAQDPSHAP